MQSLAQRRLNSLQDAQGEDPPMQTGTQEQPKEKERGFFFEKGRGKEMEENFEQQLQAQC